MNTKITYFYQDWGGSKKENTLVFCGYNPQLITRIKSSLENGEFFIAKQVGLPELFFWMDHQENPSLGKNFNPYEDHPWHQIQEIEQTDQEPSSPESYPSLEELSKKFSQAEEDRWDTSLTKTPDNQPFIKP